MTLPKPKNAIKQRIFLTFISILVLLTNAFLLVKPALAVTTTLTNLSDTLSNMAAAAGSTHTIVFTVTSTSAITSLSVTTSSAWGSTPSTTAGNYTVTDQGVGKTVNSVVSSTTNFTLTMASFTPSASDVIKIISPSITNQAAGTYTETIATSNENGTLAVLVLTSGNNQVALTGTVPPTIAFSVSPTSLTLPPAGNITQSTTTNASNTTTLTFSTNAANGGTITVYDANAGLVNTLYGSFNIPSVSGASPVALSNGTAAFGLGETTGANPSAGTIATRYSTSAVSSVGQLETLASGPFTFWTLTAPVSSATATPYFNCDISATTAAGPYADTITFIATGIY